MGRLLVLLVSSLSALRPMPLFCSHLVFRERPGKDQKSNRGDLHGQARRWAAIAAPSPVNECQVTGGSASYAASGLFIITP